MDSLTFLQTWFASQCDGDWEHTNGVRIETMDNPRWTLTVDLTDTDWENVIAPPPSSFEIEEEQIPSWVENHTFHAVGKENSLSEVLDSFRQFIENNPPESNVYACADNSPVE